MDHSEFLRTPIIHPDPFADAVSEDQPSVVEDDQNSDDEWLTEFSAANGPVPGARSSPAPPSAAPPGVPNGKSGTPFSERSNPMVSQATVSSKDPKAAAQAANDMRNVVRRKLTGYVGFANLPNQWHRKSVRKGFNFNVMVVGM